MRPALAAAIALLALAGPARAAAPSVAESLELLRQSVASQDAGAARALAGRAAEGLAAAQVPGTTDCDLAAATAEAFIRAGRVREATPYIAAGRDPKCDLGLFTNLSAWAYEYSAEGVRRGKGANLAESLKLYLKAADLLRTQPQGAVAIAAARANAAEIALLLGDTDTARKVASALLSSKPEHDLAIRGALAFLGAAGPSLGEGAAADAVDEALGGDRQLMQDIADARVTQLKAALDERPGDPNLLAAAGFWSLLGGQDITTHAARRQLDLALESGFPLPEAAYLRGRAAEQLGEPAVAKDMYRRQLREFPTARASRLAANDLAYLLATQGGTPAEMAEALAQLDTHLRSTPGEAAMHETRALLLERMGRKAEALAAMQQAQALEPSPAREEALKRLR